MGAAWSLCTEVQPGGTRHFDHRFVIAHRAFNQAALQLALKIIFRAKPTLKRMALAALEIQDFHASPQTKAQLSTGLTAQ